MSGAEASKGRLERATLLRGRRGEPLAKPARRGVHADLAARLPVDKGEIAQSVVDKMTYDNPRRLYAL